MSGGVDSSVAAALLVRAGYDVVGITMRLWTEERDDLPETNRSCCGVEAVEDAQWVAHKLGIPYYLLNFEQSFQTNVVDYFTDEYLRGRTPNPCLACNQYVKFAPLMDRALALGADYLATGHYARVVERDHGFSLLRAVDAGKDQSYFLYTLGQAELQRVLMPVGSYTKAEIRALAKELDLPVADKPDSQEICFIPDNDYRRFVTERVHAPAGDIVDLEGEVLGAHRGLTHYTVGQRHGLGLGLPQRLYVTRLDPARNRVVVGPEDALYGSEARVDDVHFVRELPGGFPWEVHAKIRHRSGESPARVSLDEDGYRVTFDTPQRALTPGQAVVFYSSDEVLGGARIASVPLTA